MSVPVRSGGSGSVRTATQACGMVVVKEQPPAHPATDRSLGELPAPRWGALVVEEGWSAVSKVLNGDAIPSLGGFNSCTFDNGGKPDRVLFVPRHITDQMENALLACRRQGCLVSKLAKMNALDAAVTHLTTLAKVEPTN